MKLLDAVAPTLKGLPNPVRVEGHANIEPVDPRGPWPSNWELSAYRATTVLRHLSGDGVPEARLSAEIALRRPKIPTRQTEGKGRAGGASSSTRNPPSAAWWVARG